MLAEHNHFTLGKATIADIDVDWLARETVKLHDRSTTESENFLHRHVRATELDRNGEREIEQHRERNFTAFTRGVRELVEGGLGRRLSGVGSGTWLHGE